MSRALDRRQTALGQLLRRPGYTGFVATVSLSRIAATMFTTSGVLLVLARTHSAPIAGATAAAAILPAALTGPVLGAWLDVASNRRLLIVLDQLLSAAGLLGLLALAGRAPNWTLPAVAVAYSFTRPFTTGSFVSSLAEIAGAELLDLASAIEATSLNLSFVIGPALAGALTGAAGPATAVRVQAAATVLAALLIAINPAFEIRPRERPRGLAHAVREGTGALLRNQILRATVIASMLATFGWGLMVLTFPLYAVQKLHAGSHAGGYLWAGVAGGSIIGTFVLRGVPTLRRIGLSYGVLGLSALAWPLAHSLLAGVFLITLTGFLEGPAYSGTIALRQRHAPPAGRAQVMTTIGSMSLFSAALGSAIGGAIHDVIPAVVLFVAVNVIALLVTAGPRPAARG